MSVLPLADYEEMRRRVFAGKEGGETPAAAAPEGRTLLRLAPRELLLHGLVENRGFVLIAAAFGVIWELGQVSGVVDRIFGDLFRGLEPSRGLLQDLWQAVLGQGGVPVGRIALTLAAFAGFTLAAALAGMYLLEERRLQRRSPDILRLRLPSLVTLEKVTSNAIAVSLPLLTLGLGIGIVRLFRHGGSLDALMAATILAWLVYGVFVALRPTGRTAAHLALAGFALVIVVRIVLAGSHF